MTDSHNHGAGFDLPGGDPMGRAVNMGAMAPDDRGPVFSLKPHDSRAGRLIQDTLRQEWEQNYTHDDLGVPVPRPAVYPPDDQGTDSPAALYPRPPRYADPECPRGCPEGECYCEEPTYAEGIGMCSGCGGIGECYCAEKGFE